jgi:phage FluMu gp28-like protein
LENGSYVTAFACNDNALRGRAMSDVFLDEAAFVKNYDLENFMKNILPTLLSGSGFRGRILVLSTPNGDNSFKTMYDTATKYAAGWYTFTTPFYMVNRAVLRAFTQNESSPNFRQECLAEFC